MIARAKAKAKQLEGPGISVLHEAGLQHPITHHPYPALQPCHRSFLHEAHLSCCHSREDELSLM